MRKLFFSSLVAFLFLNHALSAQCAKASRAGFHIVQYGETLYKISKLYDVSIDDLRAWNNMRFNEILSVCQELNIQGLSPASQIVSTTVATSPDVLTTRAVTTAPEVLTTRTVSAPSFSTTTVPNNTAYTSYQQQSGGRHIIQSGETIANIARLYGYTEARFREFNALLPQQELTTGSVLLTTDCPCNRISYSNQSQGLFQGYWNGQVIQQNNDYYHKRYDTGITTPAHASTGSNINQHYTPPSQNTSSLSTSPTPSHAPTGSNYINQHYTPPSQNTSSVNGNLQTGTRWGQPNTTTTIPGSTWRPTTPTTPNGANIPPSTINPVNTGRPASSYINNEEQQMINEINLVRSNPAGYIPYVEQYIKDINSGRAFGSSTTVAYELIDELRKTPPLSVLQPSECLYQAARQHGQEIARVGTPKHQGQDGTWPWDRAKRACPSMQDGNENLVGGPDNIREVVLLLLVDEGISKRGHRKTLLKPDWKYVACYKSGQVGSIPNNWVQMFGL